MLPRRLYSYWVGDQEAADRNQRKINGEIDVQWSALQLPEIIRHSYVNPIDGSQYADKMG